MIISNNVEYFVNSIFDFIVSDNYILVHNDLKKLTNCDFYYVDSLTDKLILHDYLNNDAAIYELKKHCPQVIDPYPIYKDNVLTLLKPIIIIPRNVKKLKEQWICIHEICHLLSIGAYSKTDTNNVLFHSYGLNQYLYKLDSTVTCINKLEFKKQNEILNDAITWYLMENIHGHSVVPPDEYILSNSQNIKNRSDIKELIQFYFTGKLNNLYVRLGIN